MDGIKEVSKEKEGSMLKIVIIVIVLIAVGFGAWYALGGKDTSSDEVSDNAESAVAVVNEEEISRADFDKLLIEQKAILGEPQDDAGQQALQNQVIDILTSKAVLLQKVNELGLSVTDEEVDKTINWVRQWHWIRGPR